MDILGITGILCIIAGILTAILGLRSSIKRIADEESWQTAAAEVAGWEKRSSLVRIGWIPLIAREYRPVISFRTANGEEIVTNKTGWAMKVSAECSELMRMQESGTPFDIRYDPKKPENIRYLSGKGFRIRESIYKLILAAVLCGLGAFMIWGSTLV